MTRQDMFSWLLGKKAAGSEQRTPREEAPPLVQDTAPNGEDSSLNSAVPSVAAEASAESAPTAKEATAGRRFILQRSVALKPTSGMIVTMRNGRRMQPAKIEMVYGSGRRILVIAEGSEHRRAFTRRGDGRYHLEGAPDGTGPAIDFAMPNPDTRLAQNKNQRLRPLRYVNLRRSPGFNVMQDGRRPLSERDKAEARGQGSATGRRPVTKGPIMTPSRSKARSRMPRASK